VAFAVGLRDFTVAATLATQAFGPPAATVGGIYPVLMLIAGALATAHATAPRQARNNASRTGSRRLMNCAAT